MRRICIIAVVAATLAGTSAFADARQHFMAGQDYYSQGRYQKAIEEFDEAYRLDPRPLLLYNIAQTWEKLGELEKAIEFLKKYLDADPNIENRTTLLNKLQTMEERLGNTGVEIKCTQADAKVFVDGSEVGKTPIAGIVKLTAGAHKIHVSKTGFADFKMSVAVTSGQSLPVEVELEPGQSGPPPTAAAAAKPEAKPGEAKPAVAEKKPEGGKKKVEALDVVPWVIAGVGVVAVGVGWGALGSVAKGKQPSDPDADPAAQNDAHKMAIVADAVGIAGAVIAAAGATWGVIRIVKKKKGESAEPAGAQVSLAPIIGDGTGGVLADVRF
jgi:hypothetical protein